VFGHRSNVSLVFDYMDTDLEVELCFVYEVIGYDVICSSFHCHIEYIIAEYSCGRARLFIAYVLPF